MKKQDSPSMLGASRAMTTIAVNDLTNAKDFYGSILGLEFVSESRAGAIFASGGSWIGIYESNAAGTSRSTAVWWRVDDVEAIVKDLKSRGIVFDKKYDLPHATRKGDIYILGKEMKGAWFRDPDGNILGVGNY